MKKQKQSLSEITLVGLTARTNNTDEMNPEKSKIAALAGSYWSNQTSSAIQHRSKPGVTYSVFTNYESDEHGEYTYFVGEAVDSLEDQDLEKFETLTIPASEYMTFTTEAGAMPDIIINAWQAIWQMNESDFNGKRAYVADFEIYDEKATDRTNAVVDIYIGLELNR